MIGETISHYRILEKLGEGGMGVVYKAEDTRLDRTVALKFLSERALANEEERIRFIREAKVAAALDHHNICTIYEIDEFEGRAFIAMAYVDGQSVKEKVEAGPLDLDEALSIAAQVAEALQEAHEKRIVHRDIKSANVIVNGKGQSKVMDFGLAKILGRTRLTKTATIMGTVSYMSPEQARGEKNIDHRTDIWSVGVLLYEMLTGKKPFDAANDAAVIHKIIYEDIPELTSLRPDILPDLSRVIRRSMARDRDDRYPDISQFLEDIRQCQTLLSDRSAASSESISKEESSLRVATRTPIPIPPLLTRFERSTFVGRRKEMAQLQQCWTRAQEGQPQITLLAGEPGIGKTRLAAEFAWIAHADGATVLYGGTEREAALPYQPFIEALGYYVTVCPLDTLRLQSAPLGAELVKLLPEIGRRLPDLPSRETADPDSERYRTIDGFTTLLAKTAQQGPLILVLDDLHWAEEKTVLLLRHVVRSMPQVPMLIVGTYRETELEKAHYLSEALADLRRSGGFRRISLEGLDEKDASALIGSRVVREAPMSFVFAICEQTKGNPFFIEEVMHHLVESGAIYERNGSWRTDLTIEQMEIPEGVKEGISLRLSRLSEECNSVLTVASVVGREFDLETLERASDLSSDTLLDLLEEAIAASIIVEVPHRVGRYIFSHDLIHETLYDELTTTRRVRLHGQTLKYADNNGVKLAYEVLGGSGPYLIAIGLSSCAAVRPRHVSIAKRWDRLSRRCRVILYDRRGVGFSAAPEKGYSLLASADDLRAVLDDVGAKRVVLWGAVDGGPLAVTFAVRHPERVAGLILAGTTARLICAEDFAFGINPEALASFQRTDSSDTTRAVAQLTRMRSSSKRAEAIGEVYGRIPSHAWVKIMGAIGVSDVRSVLAQIQAPTLILHDPDNTYIPVEAAHYLHEHIPGSGLEVTTEYGPEVYGANLYNKIETFIEEITGYSPPGLEADS